MIGSAKITYTNENVCQLVRKDLVDKFGNRELANYNLYLPGVVRPKAVVTTFPNPEIKETTVAQQMSAIGVYPLPQVPRGPETVEVDVETIGGAISSVFDNKSRTLTVSGGPVSYVNEDDDEELPEFAHWYKISVGFPAGFLYEEDDILGYLVNGRPQVHVVTADEEEAGAILILLDAKYTTVELAINWKDTNEPETIHVVCNATLDNAAIDKIPAFPTEPKFEFIYPTDYSVDANVQVDVDLDMGKE